MRRLEESACLDLSLPALRLRYESADTRSPSAAGSGSFARFEPTEERENARNLKAALTQDENKLPAPVTAVEEFQETADAVTSRIEQADKLLTAAADRQLLDPGNVNSEIDALLDLFGRLDRAGRFEEQLKLMRSLNGLLALTLRWLDLIRSLRSLLRSAEATGHQAGPASGVRPPRARVAESLRGPVEGCLAASFGSASDREAHGRLHEPVRDAS